MAKMRKSGSSERAAFRKAPAAGAGSPVDRWRKWLPLILVFAALLCYWTPLTSAHASIQWDAADEFQPGQAYLSNELHAGRLPFWTPYIFSGFPFLADPQLGAWYPLHWPFLLAGPTAQLFVAENLLHALLACFGAWLLAEKLFRNTPAALFCGLSYGLSGFFAAHSSHTPMIEAAAWLPWLLLLFERAMEDRALRNGVLASLVAGMIVLAGHFQTALYCFAALGLFALAGILADRRKCWLAVSLALAIPAVGACLSAVAAFPGLELASLSIRAGISAITRSEGFLTAGSLATLLHPDFYGVITGPYSGPRDITQYYFYAGILLLPLAVVGLRQRTALRRALCLAVPCLWYAAGTPLGLYNLVARLPGFRSVRAPVHIWFVAGLALSLLAAAGFVSVTRRWPQKWLPLALLAVACADLRYWNSDRNPLAYSRESWAETYGAGEDLFARAAASMPPLTRFEAPEQFTAFGPLDHPLDARVEATYGYNPLVLSRYAEYTAAIEANPDLRNGLNVSRWLDARRGAVLVNPDFLPRANFPAELVRVRSAAEGRNRLAALDQKKQALVPEEIGPVAQDANGTAQVRAFSGGHYRIHYRSASASVLRIGSAYFPGWTAHSGARELPVFPVDHALLGTLVPAGERDIDLDYHSRFFAAGLLVTLACAIACGIVLWSESRRNGTRAETPPHAADPSA
jgi:hypothetical protein